MVVCHAFEAIQMAWNRVPCQPRKQAAQLPFSQEVLGAVPLLYRAGKVMTFRLKAIKQ
jgi:hypothetical protein